MLRRMKISAWFHALLLIVAILGLVAGPITAPVNGAAMAPATVSAMPDDMPSCPPDTPAVPDCQKPCPLMACMGQCFSVAPPAPVVAFAPPGEDDPLPQVKDAPGDGLIQTPPARPPRT